MNTIAWVIVAFLGGACCGVLWRESYDILTGKADPMPTVRRALRPRPTTILTGLLILSMLFVAAVGVGIIIKDSGDRAREACQVEFNEKTAIAREARVSVSTTDVIPTQIDYVKADLAYQQGLLDVVTNPEVTVADIATVISTRVTATQSYYDALKAQETVAQKNPYPPADYCTNTSR